MIRFGLCCIFLKEPIKFRRATAKYMLKLDRQAQLKHIAAICRHNAKSLFQALQFCNDHDIGAFRVNSQILPLKTHPGVGYDIRDLPNHQTIIDLFMNCGEYCLEKELRTTFHPDQFILLSSPNEQVTRKSIIELRVDQATELAINTWNREPVFHLSSPLNGWQAKAPNKHHDYIDPRDFPDCWLGREITVEVEAKAKELAVLKLKKDIDALNTQ